MAMQAILVDLGMIEAKLAAFYEPDDVRLCLRSPHPQLDGALPRDLIRAGRAGDVLAVINRLDSGR